MKIKVNAINATENTKITIKISDKENQLISKEIAVGVESSFNLPNTKLWSPESPFLYDLTFELKEGNVVKDHITSYFGMRKISLGQLRDKPYIYLNNEPYFQYGPLDQGFWPDGLYTAPGYDALRYDLEITKDLGFNMTRKHLKVEPARWYYYCDSIGLMVWQDLPPGWDDGFHRAQGMDGQSWCKATFIEESKRTMKNLINYPSIVVWVAFNEGGAQFGSAEHTSNVINEIRGMDDGRLINPASGWVDFELGDMADAHSYTMPSVPDNVFGLRANVCGETGGYSLETPGHQWGVGQTIYNKLNSAAELTTKLEEVNNVGLAMTGAGLCAIVYTQITDLENELNGFYTYDRISKLNASQKARFKVGIEALKNKATVHITSTGLTSNFSEWKYLLSDDAPVGWNSKIDFDDSDWLVGAAGFGAGSPPGARIRTVWDTSDIVMRKKVFIPNLNEDELDALKLLIHHDDDVQVYINGVLAASVKGYTASYKSFDITPRTKAAIKLGEENLIAVKCHQEGGGQYIDVGLLVEIPFDGEFEQTGKSIINISTPEEFDNIRNNMDGTYRITADIDLSLYDNFEAIGSVENPFRGSILGNNHVIENLNISNGKDHQGLFGYTHNASISDLKLLAANVEGNKNVAALIGLSKGTIVEKVAIVDAYVKGTENVGSFMGESKKGAANIIHNSYTSKGKIHATTNNAGGIIGVASDMLIEKVYFTGSITAPKTGKGINAGGIVALSASDYVKINQLASLADSITGGTSIQFITRTSARTPLITPTVFTNSEMYLSNFAESDRGLGRASRSQTKKLIEFKAQELYESIGWDFDEIWQMSDDEDFPILKGISGNSGLNVYNDKTSKIKIFTLNGSVIFETDNPTQVWIIDSLGRTVKSLYIENRQTITLPKGIYIIKGDDSGDIQSQKFVVN